VTDAFAPLRESIDKGDRLGFSLWCEVTASPLAAAWELAIHHGRAPHDCDELSRWLVDGWAHDSDPITAARARWYVLRQLRSAGRYERFRQLMGSLLDSFSANDENDDKKEEGQ